MKIKSVIAILAACCFFWFNPGNAYGTENNPVFHDVKGSFAERPIKYLTKQGFIRGVGPGRFAPGAPITRLQFAILVAKALGVQPYYPLQPSFNDILPGSLAQGYAEALANLGLIKGTGENTFGVNGPLRRQDAAVIIRKALTDDSTEVIFDNQKYADSGQISPYAVDSVAYITNKGWLNGSHSNFQPLKNLTRAEAAVLIEKLLKSRTKQAQQEIQPPAGPLKLRVGETKELGFNVAPSHIAFSTVYGIENPSICSISSDGALVSGKQEGTGTLTVNAGSSSQQVAVEILKPKTGLSLSQDTNEPTLGETGLMLSYRVLEHSPDAGFKNVESKKYRPVEGLLSQSDNWTGFLRQQGRDIVIDLGALNNVSGASMEFMQNAGLGIYLPKYIMGAVSTDGVSWYQLGRIYHGIEPTDENVHIVALSLTFPSVTARYIKLSFPVDVLVFARHLNITRGAEPEKPVVLAPVIEEESKGGYLQDPNIKDILLLFTGGQGNQQTLSTRDFLPLVAYLDRQGKIKGRMFDTMLFLPYGGLSCTKAGWDDYLNDLFAPDRQLQALEDTVAQVNNASGVQKKEKVILTLPYPDSSQPYFDDTLSFTDKNISREQAAINRYEAVKSYYGDLMEKWNQAGFENLDLAGMYWYSESVNKTVYQETYLVQQVAQMVRGNNQKFFWIPYYGAQGYGEWASYGFTHVLLQPNYYATQTPPEDRMERAADMAEENGTGIEIEFDNRILYDPYYNSLFYKELNKAHQQGLDRNTVNAYYAGTKGTLLDAVYSNFPEVRRIYDDLYRWISGIYK